MRIQIAIVAVCTIASCAGSPPQVSMDSAPVVRICQIRENPHAYIGRLVRIKATYETDHLTYGFLKDGTCEAEGTMEVSSAPTDDKSVKAFFSAVDSKCVGARVHMCPVSVDFEADGLIGVSSEGVAQFEFKHVHSRGRVRLP